MEFHEKLQQLRKQSHMTQEDLAQRLYVSRTAVSKWESGRGYPNLESLKAISKLFSVTIDELLSNDELIDLAETETRSGIRQMIGLVFGVLDLITAGFLFLPLVGIRDVDMIRTVTLLESGSVSESLRVLYLAVLLLISLFGAFELVMKFRNHERGVRLCKFASVLLWTGAILLFALSRQPYLTAILFLLFMVKIVLLLSENK